MSMTERQFGSGRFGKAGALALAVALMAGGTALAQQAPGDGPGKGPGGPPPFRAHRPPMEHAFGGGGVRGQWWNNPRLAERLGLTADQQKQISDTVQQSRLKLIDLHANLQKEEVTLEPLISADQPDESRILSQIDRVAQARAELEKANARMLLSIRRILTPDQWKKLHSGEFRGQRPGGPGGPGGFRGGPKAQGNEGSHGDDK